MAVRIERKASLLKRNIMFSIHAVKRMFERNITQDDIMYMVAHGQVVEEYPDDSPYPSRLLLGRPSGRPIHIVVAENTDENKLVVVTVYEPDPQKWDSGFTRRLK